MTIRLDLFSNSIPKIAPRLLPNESSQVAKNVDLSTGSLIPLLDIADVSSLSQSGDLRSFYKLNGNWLAWTTDVDVVEAQVDDSDHRIYYTGDSAPKQTNETLATSGAESTYPTENRKLGVTPPSSALTVTILGTGDGTVGDTYSYYYTYVTAWGEESSPSPATGVDTLEGDQYVRLSGFVLPGLVASGNDVDYFRVYRGVSGTDGSVTYQLVPVRLSASASSVVTDIPSTTTEVWDSDSGSSPDDLNPNLGESCPTEEWDVPPSDLQGLLQFQNGILVGFSGKTVYLSEPSIPYAYPEGNQYVVDEDIVGIGVYKSNIIIATDSYPTILQGVNASNMVQIRLPIKAACLSKRGLVSTPTGVIYPTHEGLMFLDGSVRNLLTEKIWTKRQWTDLGPSTLMGAFYEETYIGFFQGTGTGFILDLNDLSGVVSLEIDEDVYAMHVDPSTGKLLLLVDDSGYKVVTFNPGITATSSNILSYEWKSKEYLSRGDISYAVGKLDGDFSNGSVTFKLYGDGQLIFQKEVSTTNPFWLGAGGKRARSWYFTLEGESTVDQVVIAPSMRMLRKVMNSG